MENESVINPPPPVELIPPGETKRLASIDALRGFDMFWIVGGREVVLAFVALFVMPIPAWLDYQLEHTPWKSYSFSAWDLIMPLFLFVSGVSMPFSMAKWQVPGASRKGFYIRLARRLIILWILGMAIQGSLLDFDLSKLRLYSNTLQSIAAGYLIATVFMLTLSLRGQIIATAALLLGYWALLWIAPGPAGDMSDPRNNFANYIDKLVLGRFADRGQYTWVLSSMGFGATVMQGVFAGYILRAKRPEMRKFAELLGLGAACLAAGWVWGYLFPWNKYIWSSSMNLWAGGWSFILLALFYWIVDIREYRKWAFPLIVIGTNAITVYAATHLINFEHLTALVFGKVTELGSFKTFLTFLVTFLIPWLILFGMYKKKWFIRL